MLVKEKINGLFFGIAIGDALFMPVETWSAEKIAARYGWLTDYKEPTEHKWLAGKSAGTWTDDTQLTLAIADSLIQRGYIDIDDIARRHIEAWEIDGDRGFGRSTRTAIKNLMTGVHWSQSADIGPESGFGNALPMKVGPIGAYICSQIFQKDTLAQTNLMTDMRNLTFMTHRKPVALESALIHVNAVKFCLKSSPNSFSKLDFLDYIVRVAGKIHQTFPSHEPCLLSQLQYAKDVIRWGINRAYDQNLLSEFPNDFLVHNTLPRSYFFFLSNPFSLEAMFAAGNAGGDTDTNASLVGGLLGALNGLEIFPKYLIDGLNKKERIVETAEMFCKRFDIS